ncbi:unnamed protein product [Owenia fusiformis]|uniref:Uncharacterized protein n=1 Tax=Owenia fusiformis TaxID=6347 RepID=A0A8J1XZJ8_OWEFU|nr:unnamed protein product [Owenia fusiformis]
MGSGSSKKSSSQKVQKQQEPTQHVKTAPIRHNETANEAEKDNAGDPPSRAPSSKSTNVRTAPIQHNETANEAEKVNAGNPPSKAPSSKSTNVRSIVLSYHSSYSTLAAIINDKLTTRGIKVFKMTEAEPSSLRMREQAVQCSLGIVVLASVKYQRAQPLHELINFAQGKWKDVFAILVQPNYKPTGPLAAIMSVGKLTIPFKSTAKFDDTDSDLLVEAINASESSGKDITVDIAESAPTGFKQGAAQGVVIAYMPDSSDCVSLITGSDLHKFSPNVLQPNNSNIEKVCNCQVFIAVMSPEYENSAIRQEEYECARALKKEIVPINYKKGYRPGGWLELGIAGKLYHRLYDSATAYKKQYDSTPMNDFVSAVAALLNPQATEEQREAAQHKAIDAEIAPIKAKLEQNGQWPPKDYKIERNEEPPVENLRKYMDGDKSELGMAYIHHEITRMTFNPPEPLFDPRGVPIKQRFDVMLSYQWDIQTFVRDLYMDFSMRGMKTWLDIWGGMLGNIYDSMSNAVESSTCIMSFLTSKYLKSANCNIEIKYAIACRKPIVFCIVEPGLTLPPWLEEVVSRSPVYELSSTSQFGIKDDGIPRINRVTETIRRLIKAYLKYQQDEGTTEEVQMKKDLLQRAKMALSEMNTGTASSGGKTCTRCGMKFTDSEPQGCKKHSAYYMGGTIMAGRWVCCQQREKDGLGCQNCDHTSVKRSFNEMSHGGCYQWTPA